MSRKPPELFTRDLKFLVDANPPHRKHRSSKHSHWLATALITVLVGVWIGSEPSASIDIQSPRERAQPSTGEPVFAGASDRSETTNALLSARSEPSDPRPDFLNPGSDADESRPLDDRLFERSDAPAMVGLEFGPHSTGRNADDDGSGVDVSGTSEHQDRDGTPAAAIDESLLPFAPSLELATGFEDQQSDIEAFPVTTVFDLSAINRIGGSGWNVIDIQKGDTLGTLFRNLGIDPEVTHKLVSSDHGRQLNSLATGPNLKVRLDRDGRLEGLRYNIDAVRILVADLRDGEIHTEIEERKITVREREVAGRIRSSLFQAGADAGLSDQFILRLAAIFKWSIDFNRDLQPGDRFSVIFEEKYIEDRKFATGGIVAAAFLVGDKKYTAVRHVEADGSLSYFSADGNSLKRAFLRSPVEFTRISSQFSPKRFHPVLKKWRAHKGVDYAAGRGTPVLATADGVIELAGRRGGYGNAVILQHGRGYSTLYGHLDGFAKDIRNGGKVRQGQVIGYVGSSGLATGPHLHYEFRIHGEHKNPLTVDVPRALPIAGGERDEFLRVAGEFDRKLTALLN